MDDTPQSPAPIPAPPPADAQVTLPPDPDAPAPSTPPDDPYAGMDYEELAEQLDGHMDASELRDIYPDASYVVQKYLGADFAEGDGGLGNDPDILRGLAQAGHDLQVLEASFNSAFAKLPPGTRVSAPPLSGPALDQEINAMLEGYLSTSARSRLQASGMLTSAEGRGFLERVAKARHQLRASLGAMQKTEPAIGARAEATKERQATAGLASELRGMSHQAFDSYTTQLYSAYVKADRSGDVSEAKRLSALIAKSYELRG